MNPVNMKVFLVTLVLAGAFSSLSCSRLFSSAKPLSEQNVVRKERLDDAEVWLNNEKAGTFENFDKLGLTLRAITKERNQEGLFIEGTNDIANYVYLNADDRISLKKFREISEVIEKIEISEGSSHEKPETIYLLKPGLSEIKTDFVNAHKKLLLVSIKARNVSTAFFDLPLKDKDGKYSHRFFFAPQKAVRDSKPEGKRVARLNNESIEISADDRFFRNHRMETENGKEPDQDLVEENGLDKEIEELISLTRNPEQKVSGRFLILANSRASLKSLRILIDKYNKAQIIPEVLMIDSE